MLTTVKYLAMLKSSHGKIDMVRNTDTCNEINGQFAIANALNVQGILC